MKFIKLWITNSLLRKASDLLQKHFIEKLTSFIWSSFQTVVSSKDHEMLFRPPKLFNMHNTYADF